MKDIYCVASNVGQYHRAVVKCFFYLIRTIKDKNGGMHLLSSLSHQKL